MLGMSYKNLNAMVSKSVAASLAQEYINATLAERCQCLIFFFRLKMDQSSRREGTGCPGWKPVPFWFRVISARVSAFAKLVLVRRLRTISSLGAVVTVPKRTLFSWPFCCFFSPKPAPTPPEQHGAAPARPFQEHCPSQCKENSCSFQIQI